MWSQTHLVDGGQRRRQKARRQTDGDGVVGRQCWWLMRLQGRASLLTWCDSTDLYLRECSIVLRGMKEREEEGMR